MRTIRPPADLVSLSLLGLGGKCPETVPGAFGPFETDPPLKSLLSRQSRTARFLASRKGGKGPTLAGIPIPQVAGSDRLGTLLVFWDAALEKG